MTRTLLDSTGFNQCKLCRHGYFIYNIHDRHIGRSLDLYGEWAQAELDLLSRFIFPGNCVVDVGANIGTHTVFFSRAVGERGKVIAFEPQRVVFQTLCGNLAVNSIDNVHAVHGAVGERRTVVTVPPIDYQHAANFGGVKLGVTPHGEPVAQGTLDELGLSACALLKIDVEGMEKHVLNGAGKLITRLRPVIYVENNDISKSAGLIQTLRDFDYSLYWHFTPFFNPDNYFGNHEDVFGGTVDANMLCLRDGVVDGLMPVLDDNDDHIKAWRRWTDR